MKVIKSRVLGYCHGVAETLKKADICILKGQQEGRTFYSIGELIHNKDVIHYVESRGLKVINNADVEPGIALVRAHGIPDSFRDEFLSKGFELIDATCVNIKRTKETIKKANSQGRRIIVIGVKGHAETNCLMGSGDICPFLVSDKEDLKSLFDELVATVPVTVVVQTTFLASLYEELAVQLKSYFTDCIFGNDLCPECTCRKKCLSELAINCDAIVVVGGLNSQNTRDLTVYAENLGKAVFQVENVAGFDIKLTDTISGFDSVGICSGTSTPMEEIDKVCAYLERL